MGRVCNTSVLAAGILPGGRIVKAFVTGATGFIGRRLVERLHQDGTEVTALVRNEQHGLPKGISTVCGDILAPDSLENSGLGCDRLYHLAAMITFDPRRKEELVRVNGLGTANVLEAACRWNVPRCVVMSSACTLGLSYAADHVLDEDSSPPEELANKNPYMKSKLATEKAAMDASTDTAVVVVNPTTVYGPGDWTLNSGALVVKIAQSRLIPVPPGGGNVVDVDDVVEGILAAGEHGQSGRRYILGGENLSFGQIFSTIASVVKHYPLMISLPGWMREPIALGISVAGRLVNNRFLTPQIVSDLFVFKYYSCPRAEQELGWVPRYTFPESVERAWAFYLREGLV